MTPFFFGDSREPLFGALDEPTAIGERGHGVIVCPPIGHEHVKCHWALRQVAATLARAGFHALRFDWFGHGDSAGDLSSATVERWVSDVLAAAEELRDTTGVQRVSLLGLRFGAALAALAAKRVRPHALVMWDPALSGSAHLDALRRLHDSALHSDKRFWVLATRPDAAARTPEGEIVGHRFSPALLREIEAVSPARLVDVPKCRFAWLSSGPDDDAEAYFEQISGRGAPVVRRSVSARPEWMSSRRADELLMPGDAPIVVVQTMEGAS